VSYYSVKVNFETGEMKQNGDPVYRKVELLVAAESVIEAETRAAEYMDGTIGGFETIQITKSKIEAVVSGKNEQD